MRVTTVRLANGTVAARREGGRFIPIDGHADVGSLLRQRDWTALATRAAGPELIPDETGLAPTVVQPGKIICAGLNYAAHIQEMGRELPANPTLFAKFADTLTGPHDAITAPADEWCVDWEGELAVVIGRDAHRVSEEEAFECIAGYVVTNDISMRTWQHRTGQWLQGKAWTATTPLGPELVTPDEFDAGSAWLTTTVNGEVMQQHAISDLLFTPADLIAYISGFTKLEPGDLILTGTPGGVGVARQPQLSLKPGDEVSVTIDGLGETRNTIR